MNRIPLFHVDQCEITVLEYGGVLVVTGDVSPSATFRGKVGDRLIVSADNGHHGVTCMVEKVLEVVEDENFPGWRTATVRIKEAK